MRGNLAKELIPITQKENSEMTSKRNIQILLSFHLILLVVSLAACGPTVTAVDARDSFDYVQSKWETGAPNGTLSNAPVVIIVDDSESMGATMTTGVYGPTTLVGIDAGDEKKKVQAMAKQVGKKNVGVLLMGYADTMVFLLEHHLSQHYGNVVVKKASEAEGMSGIHVKSEVTYTTVKRQVMYKVDVELSGAGVTSVGKSDRKFKLAHMGWFVPLLLLTFPLFSGIPLAALDSSIKGTLRVSVLDAMDGAAAQFAASLASGAGTVVPSY